MQFKRNSKDLKLFLIVSIVLTAIAVVSGVLILIFKYYSLLEITIFALLGAIICFVNVYSLSADIVVFNADTIEIVSNHGKFKITIEIAKCTILLPSQLALKNRLTRKDIIIVTDNRKCQISYSTDITEYLQTNLKDKLSYYDNYLKSIES